ncbi:hypothetical protein [Leucobacter sp. cx-169]|uniref:hypothetical protein n=1 Tax=Leucobacter sp. cx-169 TaxID=2770549 RepID=UPI00165DD99B|nr:hypothetical protein [Leucobacter sp. cx-169]MBC9927196.1 hypothetical protein [Leucobacter sp. cx-169]
MSLQAETFFAVKCDFPECGDLYDGGEYTYFADGPDAGLLDEAGWLYDESTDAAFCSEHTMTIECPPEGFVTDPFGDRYCQWCEDHGGDGHLVPMPDTWENRLKCALDRVTRGAHQELDRLERKLTDQHGPLGRYGSKARAIDAELTAIWERTCRDWKPDITAQGLFELRSAA